MNLYSRPQNLFVSQETWRTLNFFWLGYILYIFFYTFRIGESVNYAFNQLFQLMGAGLFMVAAAKLIRPKFDNAYVGLVFKVYVLWLLLVVLRGYTTDYEHIKKMLFDGWFGVFIYASPFLLLFPRNLYFHKRVFDVAVVLGVLCILMYLINLGPLLNPDLKNRLGVDILETTSKTLGIPLGFILMTYPYHSRNKKIIAWIVLGLTIFFAVIRARRGLIFMALAPIMVAYVIYMYRTKVKTFIIVGSVLLGLVMIDYAVTIYTKSDTFRYLKQRSLEDTRSG